MMFSQTPFSQQQQPSPMRPVGYNLFGSQPMGRRPLRGNQQPTAPWETTSPGFGSHSPQQPTASPGGSGTSSPYYPQPYQPPAQTQQPAQIQTTGSITQQPIYNPAQTQNATNQAIDQALVAGDLRSAMKAYDRPGVSRSASSVALALPTAASGRIAAADAGAQIPFSDAMTNAQQQLAQQMAREQESQGWGTIGAQQYQGQSQYNQALNDLLFGQYQNTLNNQFGMVNNTFGLLQALGLGV